MIEIVSEKRIQNYINLKESFIVYTNHDDVFADFYKALYEKITKNKIRILKVSKDDFVKLFNYHQNIYPVLVSFNGRRVSDFCYGFNEIYEFLLNLNK